MLQIKNLSVSIDNTPILTNISLVLEKGKTYYLLGKNGSGKSSLVLTLMGHPRYAITAGNIIFQGEDITHKVANERSLLGIFLSFQSPLELQGIKVEEFLRSIYNVHLKQNHPEVRPLSPLLFRKFVAPLVQKAGFEQDILEREVNVGLSGGEKKRLELLQAMLISPGLLLLDEIDAGLDRDAFLKVLEALWQVKSSQNTFLLITHNFALAQTLPPDEVILLDQGRIIQQWGKEIFDQIIAQWYTN